MYFIDVKSEEINYELGTSCHVMSNEKKIFSVDIVNINGKSDRGTVTVLPDSRAEFQATIVDEYFMDMPLGGSDDQKEEVVGDEDAPLPFFGMKLMMWSYILSKYSNSLYVGIFHLYSEKDTGVLIKHGTKVNIIDFNGHTIDANVLAVYCADKGKTGFTVVVDGNKHHRVRRQA